MPIRTVSNAGGNYNATPSWVEAVVPTSSDDVVFTSTSGPLTGTGRIVFVDSSFYSVSSTFGGFSNGRVTRSSWNGGSYV